MADKESDKKASGSGHQTGVKKKEISPTKECIVASHSSVGPLEKKKYLPTIPPPRAKKTSDSQMSQTKPIQTHIGIPERKICGRESYGRRSAHQERFQPREHRPPAHSQQKFSRDGCRPPAHSEQKFSRDGCRPQAPQHGQQKFPQEQSRSPAHSQQKFSRDECRPPAHSQQKFSRDGCRPPASQQKFSRDGCRPPAHSQQKFLQDDYRPQAQGTPYIIQTEGAFFGPQQKERKCGAKALKTPASFDHIQHALRAVDLYEPPVELDVLVLKTRDDIQNEDVVTVHRQLSTKLKKHQIEGVRFMWDCCFKNNSNSGCVLAHCMGLGKSLQVVTLCHTVLMNPICQVNRVLVVCPVHGFGEEFAGGHSVSHGSIFNWMKEFRNWLPEGTLINLYEIASCKAEQTKKNKLNEWRYFGGVFIIGYEMFLKLYSNEKEHSERDIYRQSLIDPGPDLVVCGIKINDVNMYFFFLNWAHLGIRV